MNTTQNIDDFVARSHERLIRGLLSAPEEPNDGTFQGPMEEIRTGDILSWRRLDEYRAYMQSRHGFDPGNTIGVFDRLPPDTGRRPFSVNSPPPEHLDNEISINPNPFD